MSWSGNTLNPDQKQVLFLFFNLRLPRIVTALLVGASLAVSGSVYQAMGIQGLVYVAFTITRDGSAQNVELRTSSGFDSLDESALEAVHRASPFAPPPQAARVVVPIQFSLK